jgi:hypothetical protein
MRLAHIDTLFLLATLILLSEGSCRCSSHSLGWFIEGCIEHSLRTMAFLLGSKSANLSNNLIHPRNTCTVRRDGGMKIWKEVLIHGGAKDPKEIIHAVLGREPSVDPFFTGIA